MDRKQSGLEESEGKGGGGMGLTGRRPDVRKGEGEGRDKREVKEGGVKGGKSDLYNNQKNQ